MKSLVRIAVLLITIAAVVLGGFIGSSTPQAFDFCASQVVTTIPPNYEFIDIIICDGEKYELWRHININHTIRRLAV